MSINNLVLRPWGWEGYIDWTGSQFNGTPPTEFRFYQEDQPTDEQIQTIIQYHIQRFEDIANQETL